MNFTEKDLYQFSKKGISLQDIENQINTFHKGFPYLTIKSPAKANKDIKKIKESDIVNYRNLYNQVQRKIGILKFVPASGAASRMFDMLFKFRLNPTENREKIKYLADNLERFAFYDELQSKAERNGFDMASLKENNELVRLAGLILDGYGLNYGNLPKGLLTFHHYGNKSATAFEEHFDEAAHYAIQKGDIARLHFTISGEYFEHFNQLANQIKPQYEEKYGIKYKVAFSTQKEYTDTLAVTPDNQPFRLDNGEILFRPGGHGALLENLNSLDADYIFIKNIDNVTSVYKEESYKYKQLLAGMLTEVREKVFHYLQIIEAYLSFVGKTEHNAYIHEESSLNDKVHQPANPAQLSEAIKNEIFVFLKDNFSILPPDKITNAGFDEQLTYLYHTLNRPIRVCGLVINEGDPGGGPYVVEHKDGSTSLQIVEKSQINLKDPRQKAYLEKSSHFNPVDIVCSVKNHKGEKYDLLKYRDPNTGFISSKTKSGRSLKALELPGLWNGSMAYWNTVFVEVPKTTFNPVKTIFDLLNEGHQ